MVTRPFMPITHAPGVLIPEEPQQFDIAGDSPPIQLGDWTLTPLASYIVKARVLATKRYRSDPTSDIAPRDLLLGWGPMSDSAVVNTIAFRQNNRFGFWTFGSGCPLPESEISRHAANTHLIPANESVRRRIDSLKVGSLVRLRGQLVEARHADGGSPWKSSLSRTDCGDGACEIIYVESVLEL